MRCLKRCCVGGVKRNKSSTSSSNHLAAAAAKDDEEGECDSLVCSLPPVFKRDGLNICTGWWLNLIWLAVKPGAELLGKSVYIWDDAINVRDLHIKRELLTYY